MRLLLMSDREFDEDFRLIEGSLPTTYNLKNLDTVLLCTNLVTKICKKKKYYFLEFKHVSRTRKNFFYDIIELFKQFYTKTAQVIFCNHALSQLLNNFDLKFFK